MLEKVNFSPTDLISFSLHNNNRPKFELNFFFISHPFDSAEIRAMLLNVFEHSKFWDGHSTKSLRKFYYKSIKEEGHKIVGSMHTLFCWSNLFYVISMFRPTFSASKSNCSKLFHSILSATFFSIIKEEISHLMLDRSSRKQKRIYCGIRHIRLCIAIKCDLIEERNSLSMPM